MNNIYSDAIYFKRKFILSEEFRKKYYYPELEKIYQEFPDNYRMQASMTWNHICDNNIPICHLSKNDIEINNLSNKMQITQ